MINYEEELKKFKPCLDVDEIESAVYTRDLTDIVDILQEMLKTEKKAAQADSHTIMPATIHTYPTTRSI